MADLASLVFIVIGLAACFRWKALGEDRARRHTAYDAVWFYQLFYLLMGVCFVAFGLGQLVYGHL